MLLLPLRLVLYNCPHLQPHQLQWYLVAPAAAVLLLPGRLAALLLLLQQMAAAALVLPLVLLLPAGVLYEGLPFPLLLLPSCQGSASAGTDPDVVSIAQQ